MSKKIITKRGYNKKPLRREDSTVLAQENLKTTRDKNRGYHKLTNRKVKIKAQKRIEQLLPADFIDEYFAICYENF